MKHVQHTVRLSPALNRALASVAQQRGLSSYQALKRAIETGLGQMTNAPSASVGAALSGEERATLSARLALIEALTDRSLFTASAAYVYARRGALRGWVPWANLGTWTPLR